MYGVTFNGKLMPDNNESSFSDLLIDLPQIFCTLTLPSILDNFSSKTFSKPLIILKVRIRENMPIERPIIARMLAFDEKLFPDLRYK